MTLSLSVQARPAFARRSMPKGHKLDMLVIEKDFSSGGTDGEDL